MIKLAASEKLEAAEDNQSLKHRDEVQVAFVCSPCNQSGTLPDKHATQQCTKFCENISNLSNCSNCCNM